MIVLARKTEFLTESDFENCNTMMSKRDPNNKLHFDNNIGALIDDASDELTTQNDVSDAKGLTTRAGNAGETLLPETPE